MKKNINEHFASEHYREKNTNVIKKIIDKFNVDYLSKPDSDIKNYYEKANEIARKITDYHPIPFKNTSVINNVYFNNFMNAVSETFLLAWLLSLNPENNDSEKKYDNDEEFGNNKDFKSITLKWPSWPSWPSYNKKSLQMCFCNLHNYINNSKDLVNFNKNEENQINLGNFDRNFIKKPSKTSDASKINFEAESSDNVPNASFIKNPPYVSLYYLKELRNSLSHGTIFPVDPNYPKSVLTCMRSQIKFSVLFLKEYFFKEIVKE